VGNNRAKVRIHAGSKSNGHQQPPITAIAATALIGMTKSTVKTRPSAAILPNDFTWGC